MYGKKHDDWLTAELGNWFEKSANETTYTDSYGTQHSVRSSDYDRGVFSAKYLPCLKPCNIEQQEAIHALHSLHNERAVDAYKTSTPAATNTIGWSSNYVEFRFKVCGFKSSEVPYEFGPGEQEHETVINALKSGRDVCRRQVPNAAIEQWDNGECVGAVPVDFHSLGQLPDDTAVSIGFSVKAYESGTGDTAKLYVEWEPTGILVHGITQKPGNADGRDKTTPVKRKLLSFDDMFSTPPKRKITPSISPASALTSNSPVPASTADSPETPSTSDSPSLPAQSNPSRTRRR
ncbi:hypothetical protein IAT38_000555 [Cryptococcus sp. DSM 104549]